MRVEVKAPSLTYAVGVGILSFLLIGAVGMGCLFCIWPYLRLASQWLEGRGAWPGIKIVVGIFWLGALSYGVRTLARTPKILLEVGLFLLAVGLFCLTVNALTPISGRTVKLSASFWPLGAAWCIMLFPYFWPYLVVRLARSRA